jgi:glycosyltransferase involved in cell wall biosynthesis
MAAGKYICYLDADDFIEPTYLEKTLTVLESDESLGSCYSWVQCFGDSDSVWETQDLDPFFLRQYTLASSHSVIRKEAWKRVKEQNGSGFLTKYNGYFEDWVFWIDMVQWVFEDRSLKTTDCYRP